MTSKSRIALTLAAVAFTGASLVLADEESQPLDAQVLPDVANETNVDAAPAEDPTPRSPVDRGPRGGSSGDAPPEFPKFEDISKDYTKVVSTTDGEPTLYTLYTRAKDAQMLAELPRQFENQKLLLAYTISSGITEAGVQMGDTYAYWKRYDKQLALMEPNIAVRSTGDVESNRGRDRVFTDRVILAVPILCMGPGGGPVIDMDALLVGQAHQFLGFFARGANASLATIKKAKAYPRNIEIGYELPLQGGRLGTLSYSIAVLPENTNYTPRVADLRVGYFTTVHQDLGNASADTPWVRYINRWKLEKADPKLKLSPPREPIVFYLENTIPVRYRRWVRDGVLEWNKAFEKVGISNAIEVYQQDSRTGAHMDKDPEDARFNFVMWTNANMGFAIGPSRVDPRTGQILDADIVMDEGFITGWVQAWKKIIPEVAMQNFGPETYSWLAQNPEWDPRVLLAMPADRENVMRELQAERMRPSTQRVGFGSPNSAPTLPGNTMQQNLSCMASLAKSLDVTLFRLAPDLIAELAAQQAEGDAGSGEGENTGDKTDAPKPEDEKLDGIPEWFIGPLLKDVIMHEVGHTLGLRHNFKASSIYTMKDINSPEIKGRAQTGSVMDYNPININMGDGPVQGDYTMATIGAYDYWAIEYGYSFADHKVAAAPGPEANAEPAKADAPQSGDRRGRRMPGPGGKGERKAPSASAEPHLASVLSKCTHEELPFGTDEDVRGPDPHTRVFDFSANSLDYADSTMRLVNHLRSRILDRMVKDGESWGKARQGYEILLGRQFAAVGIAAGWIGGAHVNRDHKGDPGNRDPITPVSVENQRRAIKFIIENTFNDAAFGLSPELLAKMTVDKWYDEGGWWDLMQDPTWPVHDRIMGLQSAALTMIMNPTTLNRVYDNEFRVAADADALTLPEVVLGVSDAVWAELDQPIANPHTARKPMVSSLRRNLQREHMERLIKLSMPNAGFGAAAKPVANLCVFKLRDLSAKIDRTMKAGGAKVDPYTLAHLSETKVRIDKALDAQYIYNTNDMRSGGMPMILFGESAESK